MCLVDVGTDTGAGARVGIRGGDAAKALSADNVRVRDRLQWIVQ
jgi:hypothetical protein